MGTLYVVSNPSMPGLYKVGFTDRPVDDRMSELNNTSVPTPFKLEFTLEHKKAQDLEEYVHASLERLGHRHSKNREFFNAKISLIIAIAKAFEDTSEIPIGDYCLDPNLNGILSGVDPADGLPPEKERVLASLERLASSGNPRAMTELAISRILFEKTKYSLETEHELLLNSFRAGYLPAAFFLLIFYANYKPDFTNCRNLVTAIGELEKDTSDIQIFLLIFELSYFGKNTELFTSTLDFLANSGTIRLGERVAEISKNSSILNFQLKSDIPPNTLSPLTLFHEKTLRVRGAFSLPSIHLVCDEDNYFYIGSNSTNLKLLSFILDANSFGYDCKFLIEILEQCKLGFLEGIYIYNLVYPANKNDDIFLKKITKSMIRSMQNSLDTFFQSSPNSLHFYQFTWCTPDSLESFSKDILPFLKFEITYEQYHKNIVSEISSRPVLLKILKSRLGLIPETL